MKNPALHKWGTFQGMDKLDIQMSPLAPFTPGLPPVPGQNENDNMNFKVMARCTSLSMCDPTVTDWCIQEHLHFYEKGIISLSNNETVQKHGERSWEIDLECPNSFETLWFKFDKAHSLARLNFVYSENVEEEWSDLTTKWTDTLIRHSIIDFLFEKVTLFQKNDS